MQAYDHKGYYGGGGGYGHGGGGHGHGHGHGGGGYGHGGGGHGYGGGGYGHGGGGHGYGAGGHSHEHSDHGHGSMGNIQNVSVALYKMETKTDDPFLNSGYGYSGPYPNTEYSSQSVKTVDSPNIVTHNQLEKPTTPSSPVAAKVNQLTIEEVTPLNEFKPAQEDPYHNPYEGYLKGDEFFRDFHFVDDDSDENSNFISSTNLRPNSFNLNPSSSVKHERVIVNSTKVEPAQNGSVDYRAPKLTSRFNVHRKWRGKNKLSSSFRNSELPTATTIVPERRTDGRKTDSSDWFVDEKAGIVDIRRKKGVS